MSTSLQRDCVLVADPCAQPNPALVVAALRAGAVGVLDLATIRGDVSADALAELLTEVTRRSPEPFAVRLPSTGRGTGGRPRHLRGSAAHGPLPDPADLPEQADTVVLTGPHHADDLAAAVAAWVGRRVLVEVVSAEEAAAAVAAGADGLIAKGSEAGGRVGDVEAFVLAQQVARLDVPFWVQGGVGLHTAAGAVAGGATGVLLDGQVALARESALDHEARAAVAAMDGSETRVVGGHRVYTRPDLPAAELPADAPAAEVAERLGPDLRHDLLPVGQEAAAAAGLADRHVTVGGIVQAVRAAIEHQLAAAAEHRPLAPGAGVATTHGTSHPVVQGPMTRVSDKAELAAAVAGGGGLPFLALALLPGDEVRDLLQHTAQLLGDRPWGVGILGFVPPEVRAEQLAVIHEVRPPVALIAGGRPSQAQPLEEAGIVTYLHVPSPGLLDLFLRDGARRFVFEGRECGGHVGPRASLPLWEAQVGRLLQLDDRELARVDVLFAGGVHDARSAAMVSAIAAPLVARGARAGVLMGTAYLFTEEAVRSGAITATFQDVARRCESTVLLETSPGHATRCVETDYVRAFARRKAELEAEGRPAAEMWAELEQLNLGRLRVASKGVTRAGPVLVPVDAATQRRDGMYMIGQVATLRHTTTSVAALHEDVTEGASAAVAERAAALGVVPAGEGDGSRSTRSTTATAATTAGSAASGSAAVGSATSERATAGGTPVRVRDRGRSGRPGRPGRGDGSGEARPLEVAVVGMAGVFPGAADTERYWANVLAGVDCVTEVPPDRWSAAEFHDPGAVGRDAGRGTPSRWGGFLPWVPFDALAYGIPPRSLAAVESVQLLSLEVAARALADAGYARRPFDRSRASVIFGAESGNDLGAAYGFRAAFRHFVGALPPELDEFLPALTEDSFPGVLTNVIAGRIANRLDLGGVNYTVDAACAASLAALDAAVKELRDGGSDLVLCGAADVHNGINDYLLFAAVHALSPTGRCRPFDAAADGIALGEGVACVVLKRLADAERDGDRVYAVVEGIGGSSDGRHLGLTAPRQEGQARALVRAYRSAGVAPSTVGLVEAHGTGTVVGDRTELATLTEVFGADGAEVGGTVLGSVKSQIGHTKCAAGLAGLIKAARALHAGVLPPTRHIETPNDFWSSGTSPFRFLPRALPWADTERRAAVSAFGFGGTNFHAVLRSHADDDRPRHGLAEWPAELVLLRAATPEDLARRAAELGRTVADVLAADPDGLVHRLRDLAWAVSSSGTGPVRAALVVTSLGDLATQLADLAAAPFAPAAAQGVDAEPVVAFLHPGQGSQRPGMLADLFVAFPHLQAVLRDGNERWAAAMFPGAAFTPEEREAQVAALTDTRVAQPALGIAALALTRLLADLGVEPDMVAGHSYGELVALATAGVFDADTLVDLSEARGAAMVAAARARGDDPGAMAAVGLSADELAPHLPSDVVIANHNGPRQTVVAGPTPAVDRLVAELTAKRYSARRLPVAAAFHSPLVADAAEVFADCLMEVDVARPQLPVWANATAALYGTEEADIRATLAEQLAQPVRFVDQIEAMYEAGARVFVEVGPGRVLTQLVGRILGDRPHTAVACDVPGDHGLTRLLRALGTLACAGVPVDARALFDGRAERVDLSALPRPVPGWRVNGHLVCSHDGEPVAGGLQPADRIPEVVMNHGGPSPTPAGTPASSRDESVLEYLRGLRQIVDAQREVMLRYLGELPADSPTAAALRSELDQLGGPGAAPSSLPAPATPTASGADPTAAPALSAPEGSAALGLPAGTPDAPAPAPALAPAAPAANGNGNGNGRGHQPVPAAPSPATATAVADPPLLDVILAVVADRTGYPVEMLDPDLDLEADLSIDSIKRIEIVGELAERVGLPGSDDGAGLDEAVVEQLAQLKTLRSIVTWIESATAGAPGTPATTDGQAAAAPTAPTPASHGDDAATAPADGPGPARPGVTAAEGVDTDPAAAAPAGPGAGQQAVAPGPAPSGTTARRPAGPTVAGSPAAGPLPDRRGTTGQAGPAAGGPAVAPRPGRAPGATAAGPARQPDVAPRPAGDQPPHGTPGEATEPRAAEPGDEPGRRAGSAGPGADRANAGPTEAEVEAEARERDRKDGPARAGGTPPVAVSPGPPLAWVAHMPGSVAVPGGRVASGEKEPPVTRRYVLETAMLAPALPVASAAGRTFVLVSDPWEGLDELRRLLERSGATVEVVPTHRGAPARPLPDDVAARLARADGVVHLGAAGTDPVDARDVFAALKPAVTGQATTLVAAVARRASLPPTTVSGVPGLMRSLARELPDRHVRSVELDGDRLNAHLVARLLADEALDPAGPVTISYLEGKRTTRRLAKGADLGTDTPAAPFDAESVVVFTGGARGITARAALAIARESRCRIELLGRSPLPGEEDLRTAAALDRPALRRALLEDGELRTPAAIEAACDRILADREIRHTMAQLRALGSPTTYHSVDVRDGERLARVLAEIREYHGRIDAVVHGAGVLDDRLARDKTDAGFDRVFATKVDGARTLVEHLDDDIRLVVFFGSVSGVFGNRGQVDYGAANDALDELALRLDGVDGRRVISIDWGPWGGAPGDGAGTGMVSPELEREYARRGIGLIQPDEGVRALLAEMGTLPGEPAQVVVMRADPAAMEGRPGTPGSWTGPGRPAPAAPAGPTASVAAPDRDPDPTRDPSPDAEPTHAPGRVSGPGDLGGLGGLTLEDLTDRA